VPVALPGWEPSGSEYGNEPAQRPLRPRHRRHRHPRPLPPPRRHHRDHRPQLPPQGQSPPKRERHLQRTQGTCLMSLEPTLLARPILTRPGPGYFEATRDSLGHRRSVDWRSGAHRRSATQSLRHERALNALKRATPPAAIAPGHGNPAYNVQVVGYQEVMSRRGRRPAAGSDAAWAGEMQGFRQRSTTRPLQAVLPHW
jgi:hypothetical protein